MTPQHNRSADRSASRQRATRAKRYIGFATCAAVVIGAATAVAVAHPWATKPKPVQPRTHPVRHVSYVGVYEPDTPFSYDEVDQFAHAIGRQPNLVSYYSPWSWPFEVGFARLAAEHDAVTLVQMDPHDVTVASIANGRWDAYLRSYARAVKAFGREVILSFGHEMNGKWDSWGYRHTPAKVFVDAWRRIVTIFRAVGAKNVTWMWTVNIIDASPYIPNPAPWWPGSSYVNWVGIDGYYYLPSEMFAEVFGPTIVDVRALTGDPILIAETGAPPSAGQPAKINDLFAGVRTYGLLGLLWFDKNTQGKAWRIDSSGAFTAFGQDVKKFMGRPVTLTQVHSSSVSSAS
jgi:mannan endo-1,4-beta-mannosidase